MLEDALPQSDAAQQTSDLVVHTIPMEFYGGKNPAPAELPTTIAAPMQSSKPIVPITVAPKSPQGGAGAGAGKLMAPPPRKTSLLVPIILGVVLLGVIGFAVWWFVLRAKPQVQPTVPTPPVIAITPPAPIIEEAPTSTPEIIIVPEEKKPAAEVLIPAHTFKNSADGDVDGLTDIEEELWGTNGALADSDSDKFDDLVEIVNLYNPAGVTPERLVEAHLVSTYINPEYQYSVYYPVTWLAQAVDEEKKEVLFTSITQEFAEVRVLPFPTDMPFAEWFVKTFPGEQLATYIPFVNKFKVSGVMSLDGMVAIITDGAHVYLITYNGGVREEVNYRQTFKMMVQSFKTSSVTTPIELLPKTTLQSMPSLFPMGASASSTVTPSATATTTASSTTPLTDLTPDEVIFVTSTSPTIP